MLVDLLLYSKQLNWRSLSEWAEEERLEVGELRGMKRLNIYCTPAAITETSVNNEYGQAVTPGRVVLVCVGGCVYLYELYRVFDNDLSK